MTVHLNWPPDIVALLSEEARQQGLSLDAYALEIILRQKVANGEPVAHEAQQREEAGRVIRELRKGNVLGTDSTIRDLIEEGRRF